MSNYKHTTTVSLRERMVKLKDHLPPDWKDQLVVVYPEYNTINWGTHLRNAYYGACAPDPNLLQRLETLFGE